MKDLRTPEEIFIDEKNIPTNDSILDKLYNLLYNIIKYIHILYLYKSVPNLYGVLGFI